MSTPPTGSLPGESPLTSDQPSGQQPYRSMDIAFLDSSEDYALSAVLHAHSSGTNKWQFRLGNTRGQEPAFKEASLHQIIEWLILGKLLQESLSELGAHDDVIAHLNGHDHITSQPEPRCPHVSNRGDTLWCTLTDKFCLLMSTSTCDEFDDILREWATEDRGAEDKAMRTHEDRAHEAGEDRAREEKAGL